MRRITSLNDLLMEEIAELLDAESRLAAALPKMAAASHSPVLKSLFQGHLEFKRKQAGRLQDIFRNMGEAPYGRDCKGVKGLLHETENVIRNSEKGPLRDNAIIGLARQLEHYEIAGYKTAREHAADVGHGRIVEMFEKALSEERAMSLRLNVLAQNQNSVTAHQS